MLEVHVCNQAGSLLRAFALGDTSEVLVGRDESCDIQILAKSVSREHCSIEKSDAGFVVRDLNSKGGTLHNGSPIQTTPVQDGMQINVGPAVLKFFESDL